MWDFLLSLLLARAHRLLSILRIQLFPEAIYLPQVLGPRSCQFNQASLSELPTVTACLEGLPGLERYLSLHPTVSFTDDNLL